MLAELPAIAARIELCTLADRRMLIGRLREFRRTAGSAADLERAWARLIEQLEAAEKRLEARRARLPLPGFPADLPVSMRREEIAAAIRANQVVVICGETGSGKTTQLPKICLSLGLGARGIIGHTQPRRIAARSVAQRIADELALPLGQGVGYKVRFGDHTGPGTLIKLMTDGILLAETQGDRDLEQYEAIIIDEAHERGLNIDFLLGYLRTLLPRRPDLKVIVTSATIDPQRFSRHFSNCPIVMVEGRTYPVEVLYRAPDDEDLDERDEDFQSQIVRAVDEAASYGEGDMLVFLSGEREIRETAESLRKHHVPGAPSTRVLPLYAKLSASEQMEVFKPHTGRRIVLATNVAETSLTVPGIRFVIDPGLARLNRYSPRTKVQRLEIEPVSRASADQRKGRCGRVGPGICIRLYSADDFEKRSEFTDPEIVRTNLASVILQMAALKLGSVEEFPFVDPPDARLIKDGRETLHELGAMTESGELTAIGRELSRLPVDPRIGRMILAAKSEGCLPEVLVIASGLSVQDPRDRPLEKQADADEAHAPFRDERSDFLSYLRLWKFYKEGKRQLSGSRLRKVCKENFISFVRLREWDDIHTQLSEMVGSTLLSEKPARAPGGRPQPRAVAAGRGRAGLPVPAKARHPISAAADDARALNDLKAIDAIHRALLAGLLSNVGIKSETGEYLGARGNRFSIFPGSSLFKSGPRWVMASEVVRTTRVYARCVAGINPEWIELVGAHLLKRTHFDPHWHRESGRVVAFERATLYGLDVVQKRRVHFGAIDVEASRAIFIHHALVEGELNLVLPFIVHNAELVAGLKEFEVRTRKADLLSHPTRRFEYFDRRLPPGICTAAQFERWYKDASRREPRLLFMRLEDVIEEGSSLPNKSNFPDILETAGLRLILDYKHSAGAPDDGVTARLPFGVFGRLTTDRAAWLIPGLIQEKIEAILRGLGKDWRRLLPPAAALAQQVSRHVRFGEGSLFEQLSEAMRRETTHRVPPEALAAIPLPDHLRLRVEVLGDDGRVIAAGRDLAELRALLTPHMKAGAGGVVNAADNAPFHRDGLTKWDWPDMDAPVKVERFGTMFSAYPGLLDQRSGVGVRLFETQIAAQQSTRAGLRRLFTLDANFELNRRCKGLPALERMVLQSAGLGDPQLFRRAFVDLVADRALFARDARLPLTRAEYEARRRASLDQIDNALRAVSEQALPIMDAYSAARSRLTGRHPAAWAPALQDIGEQLRLLLPVEFLSSTPFDRLPHLPRYLAAIELRLQRLTGPGAQKDDRCMAELAPIWRSCLEVLRRGKELGLDERKVQEFRWMVEELRVSLFAQELGTAAPVSVKRILELWEAIVKP